MTSENKLLNALLKELIAIKEDSRNEGRITKEEVKDYLQEAIRSLSNIDDREIDKFLLRVFKSTDTLSLSSMKQYFRYNITPVTYERNVSYSCEKNRNHNTVYHNNYYENNRKKLSNIYPSNAIELFSFEYPQTPSSSLYFNKVKENIISYSKRNNSRSSKPFLMINNHNINGLVSSFKKEYFLPNRIGNTNPNYILKLFPKETRHKGQSLISMLDTKQYSAANNEYIFQKGDYNLNDPDQKKEYYLSMKKEIAAFANKKAEVKLNNQSDKIFDSIDSQLANLIQLHSSKETIVKQE